MNTQSDWQRKGNSYNQLQPNQQPNSKSVEIKCRAHFKMRCTEFNLYLDGQHHCQAMLELKCGCVLPVVSDVCVMMKNSSADGRMNVAQGIINGAEVNVLRDSGCSTVVVRKSLVKPQQLTGNDEICVLIDVTIRRMPVAIADLYTPFLKCRGKVVCMENPLYDVIIGNVPDIIEYQSQSQGNWDEMIERIQAVITRQAVKKEQQ